MALYHLVLLSIVGSCWAYGPYPPPPYSSPSYGYDYCDPKQAPKCIGDTKLSYCLEDEEYPTYEIQTALKTDYNLKYKYSDVSNQSADDLVDVITKEQEESFEYSFYTGQSKGESPFDLSHWVGPEGYNCPSEVGYLMPLRAQNVAKEWRVIVNRVEYYGEMYTQTLRQETCLFPESACRLLAPCYHSKCLQQHVYHRLLSFDPCDPHKGLFIDLFKFPSACSCQLTQH